jgi:predicted DNA-binding transcriptional regulator AlpA
LEVTVARIALRRKEVLRATGWSNSTLYTKISEGKFPGPTKLDPEGHIVVWWNDEIEAIQKAAVERQTVSSAA